MAHRSWIGRLTGAGEHRRAGDPRVGELAPMLTDLESGLIGGYGTDAPVSPVHQLTAERVGITPDEARRYAARLIRVAHDH